MPDEGTFYAPIGYAALWPWIAGALVLCVIVAVVWALMPPRRERPARQAAPAGPVDVERARRQALAEIDRVVAAAGSGAIDVRAAHQELSILVRRFADAVSRMPATTMTLAEIRAAGAEPIATGVARLYPGEFSPADRPLDAAAAAAREAVTSWS